MKTLRTLTLTTLLAAGLFAGAAQASTLSSKSVLSGATTTHRTAVVSGKPVDAAAISSKADAKQSRSESVTVSRTQNCSKPMDMASNTCEMHCR